MTAERWLKIEEFFNRVVELAPEKRREFLRQNCDEGLRGEVESLLDAEESGKGYLKNAVESAAKHLIHNSDEPKSLPHHIGAYKVIRQIGRGGMGSVFLAVREGDEFRQKVAIKLIRRGMDTEDILRRFRNERRILASLEHPNIARLIDGGTSESGTPYFVMEFVEGVPLLEYCDENKLTTTERLDLFRAVCSAVSYAHQNLIIHRDIKPANILVTKDGTPKLLDFGIAKLVKPDESGATLFSTQAGFQLMTPEYASPEQVRGDKVTTATDIYSLGVVLYELLTGHRPFQIRNKTAQEMLRVICEEEPLLPSAALSAECRMRSAESKNNSRSTNGKSTKSIRQKTTPHSAFCTPHSLKGDLDNIVLRSLHKEAARRYSSVEQFSEDIRRHLNSLPINARPDTFTYRAGKFIERHKLPVALAALFVLTLLSFAVVELIQSRRIAHERDRARIERDKAEKVSAFLTEIFREANPAVTKGKDVTARELLDKGAGRVRDELRDQPEVQAELMRTMADAYSAMSLYDRAEPLAAEAVALNRRFLGNEHLQTIRSLETLNGIKMMKGDVAATEPIERELLRYYRSLDGASLKTAYASMGLSLTLGLEGKREEARQYWQEGFEIADKVLPPDASQRVEIFSRAASGYWEKQDFAAAEPYMREVSSIGQRVETTEPLVAARAYGNYGRFLMDKGDFEEAEVYLRKAVEIRRPILGEENFMVGVSLFNVGHCLFLRNRHAEAESALRRVLEIYRKNNNGTAHLADALYLLAEIVHAKGDFIEAEKLYREAIDEAPKAWGAQNHRYTMPVGLARLLVERGKTREAEPMLREALPGLRQRYGENHTFTAAGETTLGACLTAQKRFTEAEILLKSGFQKIKKTLPSYHHTFIYARQKLLEWHQAQNLKMPEDF